MRMEGGRYHKKGLWAEEEDKILTDYVKLHGKGQWNRIPKKTGLKRCGKSCRLRWMNYLSPTVNRGSFTEEEEDLIIRLHKLIGNRWSLIAKRVPGRTDNQVKNYWNTHLSKKLGIKKQNTIRKSNNDSSGSTNSASSTISHTIISQPVAAKNKENVTTHENDPVDIKTGMSPVGRRNGYDQSFDFDDEFELSGISSMELLNQYAADFDWQCL